VYEDFQSNLITPRTTRFQNKEICHARQKLWIIRGPSSYGPGLFSTALSFSTQRTSITTFI
jgi:hypothetical protein